MIHFLRCRKGTTSIEFALIALLFFISTFGLIEFSIVLWQWNSANKAVESGARLAAVSDPLSPALRTMTDPNSLGLPLGSPMPAFDITCVGASMSCSDGTAIDPAALNVLVFGRDSNLNCGVVLGDFLPGMCDIFPRIRPENVIVEYTGTGLGFVGRPGGPVPTITVRLTGLQYNFVILDTLLGFNSITMPDFLTTVTGEDLNIQSP